MLTKKRKIILALLILALFSFVLGRLAGSWVGHGMVVESSPAFKGTTMVNILVMGIDARDTKTNTRSDTMILFTIDPEEKRVSMLSIPRDTRIETKPGHYDRINSVNYTDGPEAACAAVEKLFKTPVSKYAVVNFAGFVKAVDLLGGVDITVPQSMYHYDDQYPNLTIDLKAGAQHLDGAKALAFARYRGGPTADIGRTANQQALLKALLDTLISTKTITKIPSLVEEIHASVNTNLTTREMLALATLAPSIDPAKIYAQTAPGYSFSDPATGASYWHLDEKLAEGLVRRLIEGESFEVFQTAPAAPSRPAAPAVEPDDAAIEEEPAASAPEEIETEPAESEPTPPDTPVVPSEAVETTPTVDKSPEASPDSPAAPTPPVPPTSPDTAAPVESGAEADGVSNSPPEGAGLVEAPPAFELNDSEV
jgi:LCP family protein required for cell wall assembly